MIVYQDLNDQDLFEMHIQKDDDAYSEIYGRYRGPLSLYANKMLQNKYGADDAVQDVFVNFYKKREEISSSLSLKAYLYTAVKNNLLNILERGKLTSVYTAYINRCLSVDTSANTADQDTYTNDLIRVLDSEIDKFPERMKEIYKLSREQYFSHREIAKQLDISEQTVDKQIQRALARLRALLKRSYIIILIVGIYVIHKILNFFS